MQRLILIFAFALTIALGPTALAARSKFSSRKMPLAGKTAAALRAVPSAAVVAAPSPASKSPAFLAQTPEPLSALSALGAAFQGRPLTARPMEPTLLEQSSLLSQVHPKSARVLLGRAAKLGSDRMRSVGRRQVASKAAPRIMWPDALTSIRYKLELHEFAQALQ